MTLPDDVTETFVFEGEGFRALTDELLERAREVAHETEERVRTALNLTDPTAATT
jgi:hypothetical protein